MTDQMAQIFSTLNADGTLNVALKDTPMPKPGPGEVLIKVLARPINPSDLGVLFSIGDVTSAQSSGTQDRPALDMPFPPAAMSRMGSRIDQPLTVGNEGSGVVVGTGEGAEALMDKKVAFVGGGAYAEYRCVPAVSCLPLPDDADIRDGASSFVNPMTAQCMVEHMKMDGFKGLVHTAAASNLGQMLVKICKADNVPLVNIVRSQAQVDLLKSIGAEHICNSSDSDFMAQLVAAIDATGAMLAFDAIGGGDLASTILTAMEVVATKNMKDYSVYGSNDAKQVYIYGSLDMAPTKLTRGFGLTWGVSGWLLTPFLQRLGMEGVVRLRQRVGAELTTTFASNYSHEISLTDMLDPAIAKAYNAKKTGEKYLVVS